MPQHYLTGAKFHMQPSIFAASFELRFQRAQAFADGWLTSSQVNSSSATGAVTDRGQNALQLVHVRVRHLILQIQHEELGFCP